MFNPLNETERSWRPHVTRLSTDHSRRRGLQGCQNPRDETQQLVQGVKMGHLARQHMLGPTAQLPLSGRRRVQLHHKGARTGSGRSAVGSNVIGPPAMSYSGSPA
jgi:hypothetical protein